MSNAELLRELDQWVVEPYLARQWGTKAEPAQVVELKAWIALLEDGKEWLENHAKRWQAEAESRGTYIEELQGWISQLESGKAWLENEVIQWRAEAEASAARIEELLRWIKELETGKRWLENQVQRQAGDRDSTRQQGESPPLPPLRTLWKQIVAAVARVLRGEGT